MKTPAYIDFIRVTDKIWKSQNGLEILKNFFIFHGYNVSDEEIIETIKYVKGSDIDDLRARIITLFNKVAKTNIIDSL